jgi:hypothetical protein
LKAWRNASAFFERPNWFSQETISQNREEFRSRLEELQNARAAMISSSSEEVGFNPRQETAAGKGKFPASALTVRV